MYLKLIEFFWKIIDESNIKSNGEESDKENQLVAKLAELSLDEIKDFEIYLRKLIINADDFKIMAAQKIIKGYVSDDSYLYFRCWLIGQGRKIYEETLKNPDYLADILKGDEICDFEGLLYVATSAYSNHTGTDEDDSFPRNYAVKQGYDYDFGAPPTKGEDWTEEELPKLLPKLWAKFNLEI